MATGRVLLVEDDPSLRLAYRRTLAGAGHDVLLAENGAIAVQQLQAGHFDVVVSDLWMPRMSGIGLLQMLRDVDQDVSVILMTGAPTVESASNAVQLGAFRYFAKPFSLDLLSEAVGQGVEHSREARRKREALQVAIARQEEQQQNVALRQRFDCGLEQLWMAYQPVVHWPTRTVFACEALARSRDEAMRNPLVFFEAADRLGETKTLSRKVRAVAAGALLPADTLLFVNVVASDLLDDDLYSPTAPLALRARRTVLEVTERASLEGIKDLGERLTALRQLGYRIALDDMGEGYAGLTSLAKLEPEVLKLDMSLVRGIGESVTKQRVVQSMTTLGVSLGMVVLAEGVETQDEMNALLRLGCSYFQGYLFAKPAPLPFSVAWPDLPRVA